MVFFGEAVSTEDEDFQELMALRRSFWRDHGSSSLLTSCVLSFVYGSLMACSCCTTVSRLPKVSFAPRYTKTHTTLELLRDLLMHRNSVIPQCGIILCTE